MAAGADRVRLFVLYEGPLRWDHGGRRHLQQLLWLAQRAEVRLQPLHQVHPHHIAAEARQFGVTVLPSLQVAPSPLWARALPGVWASRSPRIDVGIDANLRWADWVMIANTVVAGAPWLRPLLQRGAVLTWDGDAPTSIHATAAWAYRNHPARAVKEAVRTASMWWFERQRLRHYDVVAVPSERDAASLRRAGLRRIVIVPNTTLPRPEPSQDACHSDLLFVGSSYGPNLHGLQWFFDSVWPALRAALPQATLHLCGDGLTPECVRNGVAEGVQWHGRVENVRPHLMGTRVLISPIFYGGGTPNKVVEAAAEGTPIVTTRYVASRLPELELTGFNTPAQWVDVLRRELSVPAQHDVLARRARLAVASHGPAAFEQAMTRLWNMVGRRLPMSQGQRR